MDDIQGYLGPEAKFKLLNTVNDAYATALQFCNVAKGDIVLTQAVGARLALDSILRLGATPVLIDSEASNWNISAMLLEVAINHCILDLGCRPKAIVVKHYMGMPAFMDEVTAVAKRHQIPLIEDCIGSLGASFAGRVCGTFGQYAIFSVNGVAMKSAGLGLLVHNVPQYEEFLQRHLDHDGLEFKGELDGSYSLKQLRQNMQVRKHHYLRYADIFKSVDGVAFYRHLMPGVEQSFAYATLVLKDDALSKLRGQLLQTIIDAGYDECCAFPPPLNKMKDYADIKFYSSMVGTDISTKGLLLPSHGALTDGDIDRIADIVIKCLNSARH